MPPEIKNKTKNKNTLGKKPMEDHADRGGRLGRRQALKAGAGGALLAAVGGAPSMGAAARRRSSFGEYAGYSEEKYDGWVRTSQYVPVRDGVKLAVDVYRPTQAGRLHEGPLPVVWQAKRYQRAIVKPDGSLVGAMAGQSMDSITLEAANRLIKHGYIIVSVDRRGTGASFGSRSELSDPRDGPDGHDITEWLAQQPWCDSKVGMFGASYEGEVQLRIAATAPPHLKAITPEVAPFDWYLLVEEGGVHKQFFDDFGRIISSIDVNPNNGAVDADKDRSLLNAALAEHKAKNDYGATFGKLPFRDSKNPATGEQNWATRQGGAYGPGLSASGVAVYGRVGWFAGVLRDQLLWYANQKAGAKKLMIGPGGGGGTHSEEELRFWVTECHRWFDYWLKGVQNGVLAEPPIHASPIPRSHAIQPPGVPWKAFSQWPPANRRPTAFYFEGGKSGSVKSLNDGKLGRAKPQDRAGRDEFTVDYGMVYAKPGDGVAGIGQKPIDVAASDEKGLTYTTEALAADMEVTGHPVARLWVTSTADDGDVFLKLEDVDPKGVTTYVGEGVLRASHRALATPPYDYFGLPWNASTQSAAKPLPKGQAVELVFALHPMSYLFQKGHRVRVTIFGADASVGSTPRVDPPPVVSLHRSATHASSITLPVIPRGKA